MAHAPADYPQHVRTYIAVFAALAALTIITVAVSYLHLAAAPAIILAITIACIKGSLVLGFFMHLINERQAIVAILILTALFLIPLLVIPVMASSP